MTDAQKIVYEVAQKALIADALRRAFEPPPPESDAPQGWGCAAHLVMFWLKNPQCVPKPPEPPLRGLVFIEEDGTIRPATTRDI
jgi:hypothetical protein